MATDWRALFSLTSRMRLSRGEWRDEILSLDRANWRRGDRGQEEESKSCRVLEEMEMVLSSNASRISPRLAANTLSTDVAWLLPTSANPASTCPHQHRASLHGMRLVGDEPLLGQFSGAFNE
ncbi:hypothetical protein EYF80_017167 [Liparis tanakae]|uniref:Uncharacterized protein n=1 Tax=Liparis tanakae TaxID=230148 RepID=A0A4Z2I413_9TELE|nr:hypothetical protein EYF80_017167 [Liparis tanakae]